MTGDVRFDRHAKPLDGGREQTSLRSRGLDQAILAHHLRLMGWPDTGLDAGLDQHAILLVNPGAGDIADACASLKANKVVVAIGPAAAFCHHFEVSTGTAEFTRPQTLEVAEPVHADAFPAPSARPGTKLVLRTLHGTCAFHSTHGMPILLTQSGVAVWWWLPRQSGGLMLVGTDLAGDLTRYRQGDPSRVATVADKNLWGYVGERPNYLFEAQRAGEPGHVRHADEWAWFFAGQLALKARVPLDDVLPGGAAGAIVITGDDDQAALDCYREQLQILGDTPVTYFLHPLTKHTPDTLVSMLGKPSIDTGLHPDALDAPERYAELLRQQAAWFGCLTGAAPRSVRNHGYLNQGYWGHLDAWLAAGIECSSNLPGGDGNVLNGSLLPGRVAYDGALSKHWSTLTAIGDGVLFIHEWGPERAAECVFEAASRVRDRGIPGVLVLNLHPENVKKSAQMHRAAIEIIESGFVAWSMRECIDWFAAKDLSVRLRMAE